MKAALALAVLGALALMLQSAAAIWIQARALPDVGLWFVVGLAVCIRSPTIGVSLAALLGYVTDLLSGTLLGQNALLCLAAYGVARGLASSFNMRGPVSLALFALLLSVVHVAALHGLAVFFARQWLAMPGSLEDLAIHALSNAIAAPFVIGIVSSVAAWLGDDDSGRPVRLEARSLPL